MTQIDQMYKITLIEDLNKIKMFMEGQPLTVEEFDELYDMDIEQVELVLSLNNSIMKYNSLV
jgi:ribonuclease PH